MKKKFGIIISLFILQSIITAGVPALQENIKIEIPLPGILVEQNDQSWLNAFSGEITTGYRDSFLMPSSMQILADILNKNQFPADPGTAAAVYLAAARRLDKKIKLGTPLTRLKVQIRLDWKEMVEAQAKNQEAAGIIPAQPAAEKPGKDKEIPIRKDIDDKYKVDKDKDKDKDDKDKDDKDKDKDDKDKDDKDDKDKDDKDKDDKDKDKDNKKGINAN